MNSEEEVSAGVKAGRGLKLPTFEDQEEWLSKKTIKRDRSEITLYLSMAAYATLFSALTIQRHLAFKTRAWDLGIFTQSLWTTLFAGRFLYHTPELFINPSGSFFGVHFSPVLFFLLPVYRISPTAEALLIVQAIVIAAAAIPIYRLAKEQIGSRIVALTFGIGYLVYPATQFVNWYDFHVQAFLPLFFGFAMYYLTEEDWPRYFIFVILALLCEEHVAFFVFFMGAYIAWKYRKDIVSVFKREVAIEKKLLIPVITMTIAVVWYWFTLWQRNTFFPTNPAALSEFLGAGNFAILGARDPLEIPLLVFLRPLNAIQALLFDGQIKLLYLFLLFAPLALLSIRAPSALIPAIPWFGFSLLSQTMAHHVLGHQYEAYFIAFIFAAAVFGFKRSVKIHDSRGISTPLKRLMVCVLIFAVLVNPISPLITGLFQSNTSIYVGEHEKQLYAVLALIPSDASILTQDSIFPHVSYRLQAYVVPRYHLKSEIRQLAFDFLNETIHKVKYVLLDELEDPEEASLVQSLLQTIPEFSLIASRDNETILLFERS